MARFQVDSAEVGTAAARTATAATQIRTEVAAMMGHLTQLQGSWTGSASASFAACAEQWRGTQAQVEASLEQIGAALNAAASTYAEAEAGAQSLFAR